MVQIEQVDDDDDHENGSNQDNMTIAPAKIQLGFSEPIEPEYASIIGHRSARWWRDWDGGQIGGRPSWLQPRDLPAKKALTCTSCASTKSMQFICQLYVPLDRTPRAFHRSFYVFGCPTCCQSQQQHPSEASSSNKPKAVPGQGIRVLRVQLPETNEFYPPENSNTPVVGAWKKHLPIVWNIHLCQVCGQRAAGKCPQQHLWFCGKEHQKEHKRSLATTAVEGQSSGEATAAEVETDQEEEAVLLEEPSTAEPSPVSTIVVAEPSYLPSVYAESELAVDEEPAAERKRNGDDYDDDDDDDDEIEARPAMFPSMSASPDDNIDGHDSDEDLEQEDLNEMVTGAKLDQTSTKDPATNRFVNRMQDHKAPEQCLRYSMEFRRKYDGVEEGEDDLDSAATAADTNDAGISSTEDVDDDDEHHHDDSKPLWIRSDYQPPPIPPCPYCQAPRAFEFQLMPQMVSFLHANRPSGDGSGPSAQRSVNETAKQALIAAQSIIDNTDPSQVPPSFAEAKAKAMKALQADLYQGDAHRVDWGVVAIYSCTKSCMGDADANTVRETNVLGAYREEFAWCQPALDI